MTPKQTPKEDLRNDSLKHYDKISAKQHHFRSDIPNAINFYYDYKDNFFIKIIKFYKETFNK